MSGTTKPFVYSYDTEVCLSFTQSVRSEALHLSQVCVSYVVWSSPHLSTIMSTPSTVGLRFTDSQIAVSRFAFSHFNVRICAFSNLCYVVVFYGDVFYSGVFYTKVTRNYGNLV